MKIITLHGRRAKISATSHRFIAVTKVGEKRLRIITSARTEQEAMERATRFGAEEVYIVDSWNNFS